MSGPERYVQDQILRWLSSLKDAGHPIYWEKRQAGGWSYKKGLPDITGTYYGYHFEIEVKAPGGHRSAEQEKWEMRFKSINVKYLVSDRLSEVKTWFYDNLISLWEKEKSSD